ncbi:29535_t:CDS:2, partial [Racocetra persica]
FNFEYDIAVSNEDIQSDDNVNYKDAKPKDFVNNNSKDVVNDPIQELFTYIFIYPKICYSCGSANVEGVETKNTYLTCSNCTASSKRWYKWKQADQSNNKKS